MANALTSLIQYAILLLVQQRTIELSENKSDLKCYIWNDDMIVFFYQDEEDSRLLEF